MLLQFRHLLKCLAETIYPSASCKHNISCWKPSVGHSFIQIPSWGQGCIQEGDQWVSCQDNTGNSSVLHPRCHRYWNVELSRYAQVWICPLHSTYAAALVSLRDGDVKQLHDNPSYRTHKDNPYLCGYTLCRDVKLWKLRSWSYLSIIQMCYPSLCAILEPAAWLIVKRLRSQFNHSRNLICKWQWFACVY